MLFKEIIPVYTGKYTNPVNTLWRQNTVLLNGKAGYVYSYHWALKG
jgi:hypothetical protein